MSASVRDCMGGGACLQVCSRLCIVCSVLADVNAYVVNVSIERVNERQRERKREETERKTRKRKCRLLSMRRPCVTKRFRFFGGKYVSGKMYSENNNVWSVRLNDRENAMIFMMLRPSIRHISTGANRSVTRTWLCLCSQAFV